MNRIGEAARQRRIRKPDGAQAFGPPAANCPISRNEFIQKCHIVLTEARTLFHTLALSFISAGGVERFFLSSKSER